MVSHQASCKLMTLSALTCQLLSLHTCLYLQLNCNYSPCLHQPLSFAIRHLLLLLFPRKMQHGVLSDIQSKSSCTVFIYRASGLRTGSLQCKLQISLSVRYGTSSLYPVLLLCIENRPNLSLPKNPSPPPFPPPPPKIFHVATLPGMYPCVYSCRPAQLPASRTQPDWLFGF